MNTCFCCYHFLCSDLDRTELSNLSRLSDSEALVIPLVSKPLYILFSVVSVGNSHGKVSVGKLHCIFRYSVFYPFLSSLPFNAPFSYIGQGVPMNTLNAKLLSGSSKIFMPSYSNSCGSHIYIANIIYMTLPFHR